MTYLGSSDFFLSFLETEASFKAAGSLFCFFLMVDLFIDLQRGLLFCLYISEHVFARVVMLRWLKFK